MVSVSYALVADTGIQAEIGADLARGRRAQPLRDLAPRIVQVAKEYGLVAGTLAGGAVGDRVGRIPVMWFSILGALPFALLLPHANLFWTGILAVLIAMIMASAFSAILVYAQELLPGRGGLGAAALGKLADLTSIATVYQVCPFLLLLGLLTAFLPRRAGAPR